MKESVTGCTHCGVCTENCEFLKKYDLTIGDTEKLSKMAYHCFLCGKCSKVCPQGIDGREIVLQIRRHRVKEAGGRIPEKGYGMLLWEKEDYKFRRYTGTGKTALFFGCNFPSFYPETTRYLGKLLAEKADAFSVFDCCGKPIAELGLEEKETVILERLNKKLLEAGVREVVMVCPNCYAFLKDKLSVPVIVEKMAFSLGKVVVNSMSTVYGTLTVGALGISNNIGGITTNPQNGFQEGASAIISQNLGAGKKKRALKAFWCVLVMNLILSVILMSASLLCLHQIADLFANGDHEFAGRIMEIYRMEALGTIPLGASAAVMAFLYGYGKTKLTLLLNFSRVFVFRIPVLWGLQHFTDLGNVSAGIVMAVSNIMTAVMSLVIFAIEFCQIQKEERTDTEQS